MVVQLQSKSIDSVVVQLQQRVALQNVLHLCFFDQYFFRSGAETLTAYGRNKTLSPSQEKKASVLDEEQQTSWPKKSFDHPTGPFGPPQGGRGSE